MIDGLGYLVLAGLIMLLLAKVIPPAPLCWIPPNAVTRGFYAECWTFDEVRHR